MRTRLPVDALAAVLTLLSSACSGGGDGGTQPGPTPAISITLSPTGATVAQGGSTPMGVTVTRSGGFTGTVNVTVSGAPSGVSGLVANTQTSGGVTTATVTVAVDAATAAGSHTLTVQASGSGVSTVSASFALTVTAVAAYALTPTPATLSVAQGAAGTVSIAIARTAFTGNVTLAAENLPSGVTASFSPNPADGASSTLTLTASAGATIGNGTVTVRGTAAGLTDRTVTVTLTVTAGGGNGSGNVTVDFSNCGTLLGFPVWVAYQDGNGSWNRVTGTNNIYRFTINQSKGAVAWTTGSGAYIWFMTRAELANGIVACEAVGTKRVTGTVAGVTANDYPYVSLGNSQAPTILAGAWTIDRVLNGPQDLIAYRQSQTTPRVGERAVIRRDVDIPNNGSAGVVDFNGAESFAPVSATVTVNGLVADDQLSSQMNYWSTPACSWAILHAKQGLTSPFTTTGIPAAQQRATDFHNLMVTGNSPTQGTRGVQHSFNALGDRTVTLPTPVPLPTVTVLAGSYRRLQAAISVPAEYDSHTMFTYWQGVAGSAMTMLATAAWVGGTATTLAFPDLSGVAGWNNAWAAAAGAGGNWALLEAGKSMGFAGNLCVEGGIVRSAQRYGTH